jgi:ABC-2 type transport system permease protein
LISPALTALVRKDLFVFFTARRALILAFVAPIAIASFFGYIFGGTGGGTKQASRVLTLVADQDGSTISRDIVARLTADESLEVRPSSLEAARDQVLHGTAPVAIVIPRDFGARAGEAFFRGKEKPQVQFLYDPSRVSELAMVRGVLTGYAMQAVSKEMFGGIQGQRTLDDALQDIEKGDDGGIANRRELIDLLHSVRKWNSTAASASTTPMTLSVPFAAASQAVTARQEVPYNGYAHSFGGMGIQFILFLGIDMGIRLLSERSRGLWQRLRAAPLTRSTLLGARAASTAILSMAILMVLFAFARIVFGVKIDGSFAGFLLVCVAFSFLTATFGLLIASLGGTPEAARGLSTVLTLLMVMLGGAWVPSFIFPEWMQSVALVVPTRWAMDGFDAMTWRGLGFSSALAPTGVLLLFSLVFAVVAVRRFRWED